MDGYILTRGTRLPLVQVVEKLFRKNISPKKTYFFLLVTSRTYSIRLTANRRAQIDSRDPGLSFGCVTIVLASIVIEIIATFCENNPILTKFELF